MKYWLGEWKVSVTQKKVPISKKKADSIPSRQSTSPTTNTRKATERANVTRGSAITQKPRQKNIIPKPSVQEKERTVEPNGGELKDANVPMQEEL